MNTIHQMWFKLAVTGLIFILLSACGGGGNDGDGADTTPPDITSNNPGAGATNIPIDIAPSATFTEAINATTINTSSFSVVDAGSNLITGNVSYNAGTRTATFTPSADLANNTTYTVSISTAVTDVAGNAMAANHSWSFTTEAIDNIPPSVNSNNPVDGATDVAVNITPNVVFSEAMNAATINATSFTLVDAGSNLVSGAMSYIGGTHIATFTPAAPLALNMTYTVTITTAVTDVAGNPMAASHSWSFTTTAIPSSIPDSMLGGWRWYSVSAGDEATGGKVGWLQGEMNLNEQGHPLGFNMLDDTGVLQDLAPFSSLRQHDNSSVLIQELPSFYGVLNNDRTLLFATSSDSDGGRNLIALQRRNPERTTADFGGNFLVQAISTGDDPEFSGWYRGQIGFDSAGNTSFNFIDNLNRRFIGVAPASSVNGDVVETPHANRTLSWDSNSFVGRASYHNGYALEVGLRQGSNIQLGDLQGRWQFRALSAGDAPVANAWGQGVVNIESDGAMNVRYQQWSDSSLRLPNTIFSIDENGLMQVLAAGMDSFLGQLSADRSIFVASFNNPNLSNGTASPTLLIASKVSDTPVAIMAAQNDGASGTVVAATGGTIEFTDAGGVTYHLNIPPGAITSAEEVEVSMTALTGESDTAFSGGLLGGVHFAPEGLALQQPAQLTMTWPTAVPITSIAVVGYDGSGDNAHFEPVMPGSKTTTSVTVPVYHFSGKQVGQATAQDISNTSQATGTVEYYLQQIAAELHGAQSDADINYDNVSAIMTAWYNLSVLPQLQALNDPDVEIDIEVFRLAGREFLIWLAQLQSLGLEDAFAISVQNGWDELYIIISNSIDRLEQACREADQTQQKCSAQGHFREALEWIIIAQNVGLDVEPATFCDGIMFTTPKTLTLKPARAMVFPYSTTQLTGDIKSYTDDVLPAIWSSSDETVATVNNSGLVSYVAPGVTNVSISDENQCRTTQSEVWSLGGSSSWQVTSKTDIYYDDCGPWPTTFFTNLRLEISEDTSGVLMDWRHIATDPSDGQQYQMDMAGYLEAGIFRLAGTNTEIVPYTFTQDCDVRLNGHDSLSATCEYVAQAGSTFCNGDYAITARKIQDNLF